MTEKTDVMHQEHKPQRRISRRLLLQGLGAATVGMVGYHAMRKRTSLAIIGAGMRGGQHVNLLNLMGYGCYRYADVRAICDVDIRKARELCAASSGSPTAHQDYRELLDRKDIAAVIIATPDHWHAKIAIDFMRAGMAVYCEKPMTLTFAEGEQIIQVVGETQSVFQMGTQQRCHSQFRTACELVRAGRLGTLEEVDITLGEILYKVGTLHNETRPPLDLDWDMWLGSTKEIAYCRVKHHGWGGFYEWSGGKVTGWGSHHLDIVHWLFGVHQASQLVAVTGHGEHPNVTSSGDVARRFDIKLMYANGVIVNVRSVPKGKDSGILFRGSSGRVFCNRGRVTGRPVEDLTAHPLPDEFRMHRSSAWSKGKLANIQHYYNFFHSIETGETPIATAEEGHSTATALHLANIAMRTGREIRWDASQKVIIGDNAANAMLRRTERVPYAIESAIEQL